MRRTVVLRNPRSTTRVYSLSSMHAIPSPRTPPSDDVIRPAEPTKSPAVSAGHEIKASTAPSTSGPAFAAPAKDSIATAIKAPQSRATKSWFRRTMVYPPC
jgi:hypothetical protein